MNNHDDEAKSTVQILAEEALKGATSDVRKHIETIIAGLDQKLSLQMNVILHHPDLTKLEEAWRGLHHLVFKTETGTHLKIKVLNLTKDEAQNSLLDHRGATFDQSPLLMKIYEEPFGTFGGHPFGCIVGDYEFDHSEQDVAMLMEIAKIAAAAHCPFITGASPKLMHFDSWQELGNPRDLAGIFEAPEYHLWNCLRNSDDAKYLGLAMPRFLSRSPYSPESNPVDEFDFKEDADGNNHHNFVWSNAAYAMAANITRAFAVYGWCTKIRGIESGGVVQNLPVHSFPSDDGRFEVKGPTEIAISERREHELAKLGFMPLVHCKNSDYAAFFGAHSLYNPGKYQDEDATVNANLSARLPYLFAACRFAHYLKCIVRDKFGMFKERDDMEMWLNGWIQNYTVDSSAGEDPKAIRPLAGAEVVIQEDPESPGYYRSQLYLRPHYQLEVFTVSLCVSSRLPKIRICDP